MDLARDFHLKCVDQFQGPMFMAYSFFGSLHLNEIEQKFCCYLNQNSSLLACLEVSFRELQHPICIIDLYVINQDICAGLERVCQTQNPSKTLALFNLKFVWTTKKGNPYDKTKKNTNKKRS